MSASTAAPSSSSSSSSSSMDDLIVSVCNKVGVDEKIAKDAIGAILIFIKEQAERRGFDFNNQITSKLKGAIPLMKDAPKTQEEAAKERAAAAADQQEQNESGTSTCTQTEFTWLALIQWVLTAGPILDLLKKLLGMFFGDNAVQMLTSASDSADLLGILDTLGISKDMAKSMVGILVKYMNNKLGPDTMQQLAESVPALEPFLDATKKEE